MVENVKLRATNVTSVACTALSIVSELKNMQHVAHIVYYRIFWYDDIVHPPRHTFIIKMYKNKQENGHTAHISSVKQDAPLQLQCMGRNVMLNMAALAKKVLMILWGEAHVSHLS